MGTNYYAIREHIEGHGAVVSVETETLHIGKSSGGWCFSLHVIPEKGLNTLENWMGYILKNGCVVEDEYGKKIHPADLLTTIANRRGRQGADLTGHIGHYSEIGPNNLMRHRIDGKFCVGHGEGTWDYIAGDFC